MSICRTCHPHLHTLLSQPHSCWPPESMNDFDWKHPWELMRSMTSRMQSFLHYSVELKMVLVFVGVEMAPAPVGLAVAGFEPLLPLTMELCPLPSGLDSLLVLVFHPVCFKIVKLNTLKNVIELTFSSTYSSTIFANSFKRKPEKANCFRFFLARLNFARLTASINCSLQECSSYKMSKCLVTKIPWKLREAWFEYLNQLVERLARHLAIIHKQVNLSLEHCGQFFFKIITDQACRIDRLISKHVGLSQDHATGREHLGRQLKIIIVEHKPSI